MVEPFRMFTWCLSPTDVQKLNSVVQEAVKNTKGSFSDSFIALTNSSAKPIEDAKQLSCQKLVVDGTSHAATSLPAAPPKRKKDIPRPESEQERREKVIKMFASH